jgi:hypothetical protein
MNRVHDKSPLFSVIDCQPIWEMGADMNDRAQHYCWLIKSGNTYFMHGPTGSHSVTDGDKFDDSNHARVDIHWSGFIDNNVNKILGNPE